MFVLDPPVSEWQAQRNPDVDRLAYTGGGYRLELDFRHPEPQLLTFQFRLEREDKRPFLVRSYSVKTQISLLGIYRVWNYRGGPIELMDQFDVYTRGLNEISQVSGANTGIPIVLCADREGRNRFSFGMLDQVEATNLRAGDWSLGLSPRGEGLNFSFEFSRNGQTFSSLTGQTSGLPCSVSRTPLSGPDAHLVIPSGHNFRHDPRGDLVCNGILKSVAFVNQARGSRGSIRCSNSA